MTGLGFTPASGALLAVSAGAAVLYGLIWLRSRPGAVRSLFKTAPVAALAGLAAIDGAPWLLVAGLGFSALGDLALSRDGERAFMAGLGAFLVAHVAYISLFLGLAAAPGGSLPGWRLAAMAGALAYAALVARWLWPHLGPMRAPVAVYMLAIVAMGLAALAAPASLWPVTAGAALFIASDTVLAAETFVFASRPRRWTAPVVWATYCGGQALIASVWVCAYFGAP